MFMLRKVQVSLPSISQGETFSHDTSMSFGSGIDYKHAEPPHEAEKVTFLHFRSQAHGSCPMSL